MKIALYPFFSQQNKRTGRILLDSCGATRQAAFVAERVTRELGWSVSVLLPKDEYTSMFPSGCDTVRAYVPPSNPLQRVHMDVNALQRLLNGADVAVLWHEFAATAARVVSPKCKLIQLCQVDFLSGQSHSFRAAWADADVVVAHDEALKNAMSKAEAEVWPMGYDEERFVPSSYRDIDVAFPARCSESNYTHHGEFLQALPLLKDLVVVFIDRTNYLKRQRHDLVYWDGPYEELIARSKVAICFQEERAGKCAVYDSVASGCVPLVRDGSLSLDTIVGPYWPHRTDMQPGSIADAVRRALADSHPLKLNLSHRSYQGTWEHRIKPKLLELTK